MGSQALASTLSLASTNVNGQNGVMFDLTATNTVEITNFQGYTRAAYSSGCDYSVYTTTSTLANVLTTPSAWSLVGSGTTGALAASGTFDTPLSSPVTIPAGGRAAFYVTFTTTSCNLQYRTGTMGTAAASNSDLAWLPGYGRAWNTSFSGVTFSSRAMEGVITYRPCTATTWYPDADADGYGTAGTTQSACSQPSGYASTSTDCDDSNAAISPGDQELCDAGNVDEDCDGNADNNDSSAVGQSVWGLDSDGDSYGSAASYTQACDQPSGYAGNLTDCNDSNSSVNPAAQELCDAGNIDEDCDGSADDGDSSVSGQSTWYADGDGDGFGNATRTRTACDQPASYVSSATDCDDTLASVNPRGQEVCDAGNTDEDCDGSADDADSSTTGQSNWYDDADGDGYGDPASSTSSCEAPRGTLADNTDCNDANASIHPGATEVCDSQNTDEDCDGAADDDDSRAAGQSTWYDDFDGDGYGDPGSSSNACDAPAGTVADSGDCDDSDNAVNPGSQELCGDSTDNNCDGLTDDPTAIDVSTWYPDGDGDSYGDATSSTRACTAPSSFVADNTDCDDDLNTTSPGATEVCDSVDNNCDGSVDESSASNAGTWYTDADGDGYGGGSGTPSCTQPTGTVAVGGDCLDADVDSYPGATELPYDGVDQDCDGADLCDVDEDGYDALDCGGNDCDDEDALSYVGAPESWYDGVDQGCDGGSDYDADGDGYDSASYGGDDCDDARNDVFLGAPDDPYDGDIQDCIAADEYDADGDGFDSAAWGGEDCDDASSAIYPGAVDTWYDGVDSDCDGRSDYDADQDGYATPEGGGEDCDDGNADVNPDATEQPDDGLDGNCDGGELCYVDADGDGQREPDGTTLASEDLDCEDTGEGRADDASTDCDDTVATTYAGATELCDDVDNSCDGTVDEGCDVDSPVDDSGVDSVPKDEPTCGCSTGAPDGALGLLLLGGLALRRRARQGV